MSEENLGSVFDIISAYCVKIVAATIILLIGLWLAKRVELLIVRILNRKQIDATLVHFFANTIHGALVVFSVVAAIGKLGIETTSFAAVIASAGLAIGLALQGSLSNFAAGVLLIAFKPFKLGDAIKAANEMGTVVEIGLLATELKTADNIKLIIPNSTIMNGAITNFSAHATRRIDLTIGVSYKENLNQVRQILEDLINKDERILKDPEPQVMVSNLNESSVDFVVRPWVNSTDFWTVRCDLIRKIKEAFDAAGVSIPFPQRDIRIIQEKAS